MKISIITPIFNEEKNIKSYFSAINKIDYPKDDFEIVLIDDGSNDNSRRMLETESEKSNLKIKIVHLKGNQGRIIARETAVRSAEYSNLLFIDCKCEISPEALSEIKKANYQPINGTVYQKSNHMYDRFLFLIRESLTKREYKKKEEYLITEETFDNANKGTGIFFCDKELFLDSQPEDKNNKYVSDDTRILWNIVVKKPILKTAKVRIFYNTRETFKENFKHILKRGPMFVDYYYHPNKKMFWLINLTFLGIVFVISTTVSKSSYVETSLALILLNVIISAYLAKNIKDFILCFWLFPILGLTFLVGIIHGIVVKPFHARNK